MKSLLAIFLVTVFVMPAMAQKPNKQKGEGQTPLLQKLTKELAPLNLTDEQTTQLNAATEQLKAAVTQLQAAGLTKELQKKRTELTKAAQEEGLKAKELKAKVNAGLSADEVALFEKMDVATQDLNKAVFGMLTPEQLELLPEKVRKQLTPKGKGAKGKKAKKENVEN